jgi:hypothetical protein
MRLLTLRPIRGITGVGLFTLLAKTVHGQETTATSSLGIFQDDTGEQCPILGCCEYDCCGKGTSWNESIGYCVEDPGSPGFIDGSSFPPSFEDGCVDRVCCEENCCQENLLFDIATSFCVPDTCSDKEFVLFVPRYRDRTMGILRKKSGRPDFSTPPSRPNSPFLSEPFPDSGESQKSGSRLFRF